MTNATTRSVYDGSTREVTIRAGGRTIRLVRPSDPDRLLDRPEVVAWNASDDYMPYWAYLWPASILLAEAVASTEWPGPVEALELGCGLGVPGLFGLASGLRVRFTDMDPTALGFVERSARANGFDPSGYSTGMLDWRDPPPTRYPLILGADLTYERRLVPLVARAIGDLLSPGGLALVADPDREAARGFAEALDQVGLAAEPEAVGATSEELGPIRGTIYRIRHI